MEELEQDLKGLSVDSQTNFVISVIAKVPDHITNDDSSTDVDDSSDDDEEEKLSESDFEFDIDDVSSFPFTTTKPPKTRVKKKNPLKELPESSTDYQISTDEPTLVTSFLQKLSEEGFETKDKDKKATISVSIALNRMKSLSARKNRLVSSELQTETDSEIKFEKFGFYWEPIWYDKAGNIVPYTKVRTFYKEFKEIDPVKARKFRETTEGDIAVPYQIIREYAKNHDKTKKLINEFRERDPDSNIYFSLVDSDTVNFNGIYSAYLRIVKDSPVPPTVMSTGFEYPENIKYGKEYQIGSQFDNGIKVLTAQYFPLGVYYPEANTCILIPQECQFLEESFIDQTKNISNLESVCLLTNICANEERENMNFIFSKDNPLITGIPDRAKVNKRRRSQRSFSSAVVLGSSPKDSGSTKLNQGSHFNFQTYVWCQNLLRFIPMNEAEKNAKQRCLQILPKIRKEEARDDDLMEIKKCLKSADDVDQMVMLCGEVNKYLKDNVIRSDDKEQLFDVMRKYEIDLADVSEDRKNLLQQHHILELIEDEEITIIRDVINLEIEKLLYICCDEEIIENLKTKDIDFASLLKSLKNNFSGFVEARKNSSITEILYPEKNKMACIII